MTTLQMVQQMLTFYELDLGLNHVVRKHNEPLEDQANLFNSWYVHVYMCTHLYLHLM